MWVQIVQEPKNFNFKPTIQIIITLYFHIWYKSPHLPSCPGPLQKPGDLMDVGEVEGEGWADQFKTIRFILERQMHYVQQEFLNEWKVTWESPGEADIHRTHIKQYLHRAVKSTPLIFPLKIHKGRINICLWGPGGNGYRKEVNCVERELRVETIHSSQQRQILKCITFSFGHARDKYWILNVCKTICQPWEYQDQWNGFQIRAEVSLNYS